MKSLFSLLTTCIRAGASYDFTLRVIDKEKELYISSEKEKTKQLQMLSSLYTEDMPEDCRNTLFELIKTLSLRNTLVEGGE